MAADGGRDDVEGHRFLIELLAGIAEALREVMPRSSRIAVRDLRQMESPAVASFGAGVPRVEIVRGSSLRISGRRELRAGSVLVRDRRGRPAAQFQASLDLAPARQVISRLEELIGTPAPGKGHGSPSAAPRTVAGLVEEIVLEAVADAAGTAGRMGKAERLRAIVEMRARGIFQIKGSVERVASALGISRFTVYNYLDETGRKSRPLARRSGGAP